MPYNEREIYKTYFVKTSGKASRRPPRVLTVRTAAKRRNNICVSAVNRKKECSEYPTVWAVDTFFYASLAKRASTAVRRALLNRDPLASDLIFIPVHKPEFGQDGYW